MSLEQRFHSLEDFLTSTASDVDGTLNDGWGYPFPVKGCELEATVLFADITAFSSRTSDMSPAATLVYVQNFFAWITAEALHGRPGIVDKYIGDEMMIVYSTAFGSSDPLLDAVRAALAMSRHDVLSYCPHIGIASGRVIIGHVGTPLRYSVSAFGAPVALAARCASVRPPDDDEHLISSSIVMPACEWVGRNMSEAFDGPRPELLGEVTSDFDGFEVQVPRLVPLMGIGDTEVVEVYNRGMHLPWQSAEDRARDGLFALYKSNRYWPRWDAPEPGEAHSVA